MDQPEAAENVERRPRSENRQRVALVATRLHPNENEQLRELAERERVSVAEVIRQSILATLAATG